MTDESTVVALDRVRAFLERFYHDEEVEDLAAAHALRALRNDDRQERWRTAQAIERVLAAELPDGALHQLVFRAADRGVLTDEEAREFLERVFESNAFDVAIDWDAEDGDGE